MKTHEITPALSVAGQLGVADVATAAAQGFRSVIINRPDGESAEQPSSADIAAAAASAGLACRYLPVVSGGLTDDDVTAFDDALRSLPTPVLAFCRSGTRSVMLWALTEAGKQPARSIIERAAAAGYDLSALAERLRGAEPSGNPGGRPQA